MSMPSAFSPSAHGWPATQLSHPPVGQLQVTFRAPTDPDVDTAQCAADDAHDQTPVVVRCRAPHPITRTAWRCSRAGGGGVP